MIKQLFIDNKNSEYLSLFFRKGLIINRDEIMEIHLSSLYMIFTPRPDGLFAIELYTDKPNESYYNNKSNNVYMENAA